MSEYFLIKAVLGKYLEDGKKLFSALGKIFLIPEEEVEKLYLLSENETAKSINTEQDFMQYQRILKYSRLTGTESTRNAEWEEIARIKGNAILLAQSHKLLAEADMARNAVYTCLSAAATAGSVSALKITGILQCEGIFLNKNTKAGVKTLSKAADWNDIVSTLALLRYCKDTSEYNMSRLRQEVANTPFEELYETAAKKFGSADAFIEEIKLLEKAFNSGVLKREVYEPKYARILNSRALYIKDKERAVLTLNKEFLCAISELPLKLSHERTSVTDGCGLQNSSVKREGEISAISRALKNSDLRHLASYRPVCLCCESKYVLNMYSRAVKKQTAETHVEIIDIAELSDYDFEPTPNNIFVRSIDEDRDNRLLLFFYGDIPERKIEAVKNILQSSKRAKFHLFSPNVTLNLSAVLPVCFCDEQNAKWLKAYCDEIKLAPVSATELPVAVRDILERKQKLYGVGAIELDGEAGEIFKGYDIDTAEGLIDAAVRARRERGATITLSRDILREYESDRERTIGFGGNDNESYK